MQAITDETTSPIDGKTAVDDEPAGRAIRLGDIVDLFARPRVFFGGNINLGDPRFLVPIVWILGTAAQIDRIDTQILRQDFQNEPPLWSIVQPLVTGPWIYYWAWCMAVGALTGLLVYFIGGWWFRVRLMFSGGKELNVTMPRYINAYSSLINALPLVLITAWLTTQYPNYRAAFASDELGPVIILPLLFWSIAVSYGGATTAFEVVRWKARLWFLILPALFYVVAMGGVVGLAFMLQ